MTIGGWIFMILAWGVIIFTLIYTYSRLVSGNDKQVDQQDYKILE